MHRDGRGSKRLAKRFCSLAGFGCFFPAENSGFEVCLLLKIPQVTSPARSLHQAQGHSVGSATVKPRGAGLDEELEPTPGSRVSHVQAEGRADTGSVTATGSLCGRDVASCKFELIHLPG